VGCCGERILMRTYAGRMIKVCYIFIGRDHLPIMHGRTQELIVAYAADDHLTDTLLMWYELGIQQRGTEVMN